MTGAQLPAAGDEPAGRPLPTGGPCVECKANRDRMIRLAHDVVTLRSTVERIEARESPWRMPDGAELTEWLLIGIGVALIASSFVGARRGR